MNSFVVYYNFLLLLNIYVNYLKYIYNFSIASRRNKLTIFHFILFHFKQYLISSQIKLNRNENKHETIYLNKTKNELINYVQINNNLKIYFLFEIFGFINKQILYYMIHTKVTLPNWTRRYYCFIRSFNVIVKRLFIFEEKK